jgi:hypothetical protein
MKHHGGAMKLWQKKEIQALSIFYDSHFFEVGRLVASVVKYKGAAVSGSDPQLF